MGHDAWKAVVCPSLRLLLGRRRHGALCRPLKHATCALLLCHQHHGCYSDRLLGLLHGALPSSSRSPIPFGVRPCQRRSRRLRHREIWESGNQGIWNPKTNICHAQHVGRVLMNREEPPYHLGGWLFLISVLVAKTIFLFVCVCQNSWVR